MKKAAGFRYNTGETRVPWAAVGEDYNAQDLMEIVQFLMQGEGEEYDKAVSAVKDAVSKLDKLSTPPGKLSLGPQVEKAEAMVDQFLGTRNAVFVSCATAGFEIAFKYANIGPGDEVIVPAITFIATMAYPLSAGAKLVFCDVDPVTLNMDPKDLEKKITPRTKMIVPVDLGGYPADLDAIMEIAHRHDILVLEDAAHSFGAEYKGRKVGAIADFTGFSLHEVKNMTSLGEGGILTTTIEKLQPDLVRCRFFGLDFTRKIKYWLYDVTAMQGKYGPFVAGNCSTTELQAVGLMAQLKRYDKILAARRDAAEYLNQRFADCDAIMPQPMGDKDTKPTFHLYLLQIDPEKAGADMQVLRRKLEEKGVTNIPHFGPLYHFDLLKTYGYDEKEIAKTCPVCEEVFARRFTHLPVYGLSPEQLEYMADAVLDSIDEMKRGEI